MRPVWVACLEPAHACLGPMCGVGAPFPRQLRRTVLGTATAPLSPAQQRRDAAKNRVTPSRVCRRCRLWQSIKHAAMVVLERSPIAGHRRPHLPDRREGESTPETVLLAWAGRQPPGCVDFR